MRCLDEVGGLPAIPFRGGAGSSDAIPSELLEDSILSGSELHDSVVRLAMRGYSRDQLLELMERSAAKTDRPDRWREVLESDLPRALKSAVSKREARVDAILAAAPIPPCQPETDLPVIKPGDFALRKLRKRKWICEPLIPRGETTLLYGPGAAGKSLLLLQLALGMATGFRWLGMPVPKTRTLFFTCEDDADELNRRAVKVLESLGVGWAEAADRFAAIPMRGTDASAVLAVAGRDGTLTPTATYEALRRVTDTFKPDVVILDTLADIFAGNENDRGHAKQFIKLVERLYPATFIVTAHPSVSGQADGRGASGSTGWPAAVRSHLYLERVRGEEAAEPDPDLRQLSNLKANYAQAGAGGIEIRWVDGVFVRSDRQAREAGGGEEADALFLELLARYSAQGPYLNASSGTNYAPAAFAKDDEAREARVSKRMLTTAMRRLLKSGKIAVRTRKASGHERSYLAIAE